jgi:O-succinylbenzoate synthase
MVEAMQVDLWRSRSVLRETVTTSAQQHKVRESLFLRIRFSAFVGFGEVSPQPFELNGDPDIEQVIQELTTVTIPQLLAWVDVQGELPLWSRFAALQSPRRSSSFALALIEMALLDIHLQSSGGSLADVFPTLYPLKEQQVVSALDDDVWTLRPDVARLRIKVGTDALRAETVEKIAAAGIPVILDYNACATSPEVVTHHVEQLPAEVTLAAVEQPFGVGNMVDHAALQNQYRIPVSLDEGIRSQQDVKYAALYKACSIICIKPARVGGLASARSLAHFARSHGIATYIGGFFESPLARTLNRTLATALTEQPSDVGDVLFEEGGHGFVTGQGLPLAPSETLINSWSPIDF